MTTAWFSHFYHQWTFTWFPVGKVHSYASFPGVTVYYLVIEFHLNSKLTQQLTSLLLTLIYTGRRYLRPGYLIYLLPLKISWAWGISTSVIVANWSPWLRDGSSASLNTTEFILNHFLIFQKEKQVPFEHSCFFKPSVNIIWGHLLFSSQV